MDSLLVICGLFGLLLLLGVAPNRRPREDEDSAGRREGAWYGDDGW